MFYFRLSLEISSVICLINRDVDLHITSSIKIRFNYFKYDIIITTVCRRPVAFFIFGGRSVA